MEGWPRSLVICAPGHTNREQAASLAPASGGNLRPGDASKIGSSEIVCGLPVPIFNWNVAMDQDVNTHTGVCMYIYIYTVSISFRGVT